METISWKIIDTYFKNNPSSLVAHHLESYNDFFDGGINRIFKETVKHFGTNHSFYNNSNYNRFCITL